MILSQFQQYCVWHQMVLRLMFADVCYKINPLTADSDYIRGFFHLFISTLNTIPVLDFEHVKIVDLHFVKSE